jgi:hypothetical protein
VISGYTFLGNNWGNKWRIFGFQSCPNFCREGCFKKRDLCQRNTKTSSALRLKRITLMDGFQPLKSCGESRALAPTRLN